ncbi:unnamed protein product, partial [Meganyctiphanes norvegica]
MYLLSKKIVNSTQAVLRRSSLLLTFDAPPHPILLPTQSSSPSNPPLPPGSGIKLMGNEIIVHTLRSSVLINSDIEYYGIKINPIKYVFKILKFSRKTQSRKKKILEMGYFYDKKITGVVAYIVLPPLGKWHQAVKLYNRMQKALSVLQYFMLDTWTFHNTNTRSLYQSLCPVDKERFNFDASQLDWNEYIQTYQLGVKQYIMKEPLNTLNDGQRAMNRMYWIDCIVRLILMFGAWCIVSSDSACGLYSAFFDGVSYLLSCAPVLVAAEDVNILGSTTAEVNLGS